MVHMLRHEVISNNNLIEDSLQMHHDLKSLIWILKDTSDDSMEDPTEAINDVIASYGFIDE